MTFFKLCCSTGVLNNLQAYPYAETTAIVCYSPATEAQIKAYTKVWKLLREQSSGFIIPIQWAEDLALSLIHEKCTSGKDDGPSGGYNNYKAAQVTWFDRLNADKRNGKRFNNYNLLYSCDHLTEKLASVDKRKFGQVLVSKAVEGAHGARVRGCVYTPNTGYLGEYLDERLAAIKKEMLAQLKNKGEDKWQIK
jgi:hypothetical protein